ncbi:ABC transporter ATP-binding protein [Cellulomonas chengniuliangii]|uniref:ABC transporter ATP-binding protein/permease n=1 Tax=Cellulomonas chengniuliangii TaxID=2968084 RepID=A0ABY5L2J9_9CELL|nr:ABC transporter ATP-binding protein [Cellulomonas chengniuliangii]MCC2307516.1 ABC transporter ATP-binding protein/permease [Cellulomonas chengniuliangii]MCC2318628.1 ABC transporter ATP-binding protein/permease [Cellulomonas chengniuliangii]UUI75711.1 ABC transporter ATP-binding protein/permease [Cellulomonas chengniuliangii]
MRQTVRGAYQLLVLTYRIDPGKLILSLALMLLQSSALPLAAPALAALTDAAVEGDARRAVIAAVVVAVLVIASLTAGHFAHIFYFELGDLALMRLERELVELSNDSPGLEHHERADYADKIQVLRTELQRSGWGSMQALLSSLGLGVAVAITAVLLAGLNPWLLALPVAALPPLLLGRRAESTAAQARDQAALDNRRARHLFVIATDAGPAKELRVCGLEGDLRARHAAAWSRATATLWRGEVRASVLRVAGQLVFAAAYVAATLLVVRDAVEGHRTVGDVILVITLAAQVNAQVTSTVTILQQLQRTARTMADLEWMREVVRPRPVAGLAAPLPAPDAIRSGITFEGVAFTYPGTDRPVLADVDLSLPPGTTVAIVGENGAGKTTLVKLLCRFYDATAGTVAIDGVDLRHLDADDWRARVAAGFQDFSRFELLARENVGVGHLPDIGSDEAVLAALGRAHAEGVLERLDHGLDSQLGTTHSDGAQLSGGQWQKLALGRAMMREAPLLLVLDEPTSALDAQAEHELFERYAENARRVGELTGAITLLVSHRFSTVRMADLILVVADGRIAEQGSHAELVSQGGLYAELFNLQAAAYR